MSKKSIFVVLFLLNFSLMAAKGKTIGFIGKFKGAVNIKRASDYIKPNKRMKLRVNDIIETGKKSKVRVILKSGDILNVAELSAVKLDEKTLNKGDNDKGPFIKVLAGKLRATVKKNDKKKIKMMVDTTSALAGIRGTEFEMGFDPKSKSSSFLTYSGDVLLGGKNGSKKPVAVKAGTFSTVLKGKRPMRAHKVKPEQFRHLKDSDQNGNQRRRSGSLVPRELDPSIFAAKDMGVIMRQNRVASPPSGMKVDPRTGYYKSSRDVQVIVSKKIGAFTPVIPANTGKVIIPPTTYKHIKMVKDAHEYSNRVMELKDQLKKAENDGDDRGVRVLSGKLRKTSQKLKQTEAEIAESTLEEKYKVLKSDLEARMNEVKESPENNKSLLLKQLMSEAKTLDANKKLDGELIKVAKLEAKLLGANENNVEAIAEKISSAREKMEQVKTKVADLKTDEIMAQVEAVTHEVSKSIAGEVMGEDGVVPMLLENRETGITQELKFSKELLQELKSEIRENIVLIAGVIDRLQKLTGPLNGPGRPSRGLPKWLGGVLEGCQPGEPCDLPPLPPCFPNCSIIEPKPPCIPFPQCLDIGDLPIPDEIVPTKLKISIGGGV